MDLQVEDHFIFSHLTNNYNELNFLFQIQEKNAVRVYFASIS